MTHSLKDIHTPESLGLSSRTRIRTLSGNHIALVIDRKSRIIMKDGKGILDKAEIIRTRYPDMKISVETPAPVCSKTLAFLEDHGIFRHMG
ncbi:MAG: hypothetical protein KKD44_07150 [Proteobacteria bacterium]|nr:hypothetical protein [Pseudomonadota bacterium]